MHERAIAPPDDRVHVHLCSIGRKLHLLDCPHSNPAIENWRIGLQLLHAIDVQHQPQPIVLRHERRFLQPGEVPRCRPGTGNRLDVRAGDERAQAGDAGGSDFGADDPEQRAGLGNRFNGATQTQLDDRIATIIAQSNRAHLADFHAPVLRNRFIGLDAVDILEPDRDRRPLVAGMVVQIKSQCNRSRQRHEPDQRIRPAHFLDRRPGKRRRRSGRFSVRGLRRDWIGGRFAHSSSSFQIS